MTTSNPTSNTLARECYICLYPTTELSPCQCKINVHVNCLIEYCLKNNTTQCSVCKSQFEDIEICERPIEIDIRTQEENVNKANMSILCVFMLFVFCMCFVTAFVFFACNLNFCKEVNLDEMLLLFLIAFVSTLMCMGLLRVCN